ncbi:hypothetical protein Nocox_03830 [Nonomuraea coxensis DSM 45129]|uniref:Uncharacterized protein n=1 Tax=Nonomuraea coxensis DSM 45129 TaxID=1122611 RepID=A0ABX8TTZ2_9ACTN|nr:hypothetical protein [Nonomuraea coxensis]QYC38394.1 hypothetical protein Nocox_03830 [Nonomuraea coxensis DSM 45129]
MGPNDAELIQVYTRGLGKTIADVTFDSSTDFEVVVETEAGTALFGLGGAFTVDIVVRDLTANDNIPYTPGPIKDTLGKPTWPAEGNSFVFRVRSADLATRKGHLCEVHAYLLVGISNFDSSFGRSRTFLIQP